MVDWKEGASMPNYLNAAANTQIVGSKIGLFMLTNKLDPKKVHCIGNIRHKYLNSNPLVIVLFVKGHSLGAHVRKLHKTKREFYNLNDLF